MSDNSEVKGKIIIRSSPVPAFKASELTEAKPGQKAAQSLVTLRDIAVKTLAQVFNSDQTLEQSLFEEFTRGSSKTLQDFDRAWVFEVCSGVLRFRGRLDYIIDTYSLKKKPTGALRRYLQTAVLQLLTQDVASALVVSETVHAIRAHDGEAPGKFGNAILRKVADNREQWKSWTVSEKSPFEEQLAWCSLPEWLFKKIRKERGSEWLFAFAKASLERPKIWYRNLDEPDPVHLEAGYKGNEPQGYVQDVSNQELVQKVVALLKTLHAETPSHDLKILDLCSAPGGKSLGLASNGFKVTATDLDATRLQKVTENVSRLQYKEKISVRPFDEVMNPLAGEKYDLIWIDAPCSSTGIIRRHPEIKWNRTWKDVEELMAKQHAILDWSKAQLNPHGIIVYSTCSVLAEENPKEVVGMQKREHWEWFPHHGSEGDAIIASVFQI